MYFYYQGATNNGKLKANANIGTQNVLNRHIGDLSYNTLAKNRCTLYIGCKTGLTYTTNSGTSHNLVESTYNKGTHFVLGTTQETYRSQTDTWITAFFEKMYLGGTIRECVDFANDAQSIGSLYQLGDDTVKLK